jgi:hypothetical protein
VTGAPREWRDDLRDRPPAEVLRAAAAVGFAGVEVMRRASRDRARPFEAEVRRILGAPVVVDADGDFAFYDLRPFAERLRRRLGPARLAALRRDVWRGRPPG